MRVPFGDTWPSSQFGGHASMGEEQFRIRYWCRETLQNISISALIYFQPRMGVQSVQYGCRPELRKCPISANIWPVRAYSGFYQYLSPYWMFISVGRSVQTNSFCIDLLEPQLQTTNNIILIGGPYQIFIANKNYFQSCCVLLITLS